MGLLLSILVSCVGVVEMITFYTNMRRDLEFANSEDGDLDNITRNYKKMLTKEYKHAFAEVNGKETYTEVKTNYLLSPSPKAIFHSEDNPNESVNLEQRTVEVDTSKSIVQNINNVTKFETEDFETTPAQYEKDEYVDEIIEENSNDADIIFIERNVSNIEFEHGINIPMYEDTFIDSVPIDSETFIFIHEPNHIIFDDLGEDYPGDVERIYLIEEPFIDPVHGDRCPSPYPTFEILAPRNSRGSISSDIPESPIISMLEVDDECSIISELAKIEELGRKSRSPVRSVSKHRSPSPDRLSANRAPIPPKRRRKLRNRSVSPLHQLIVDDPTPHLKKRRRSKSSSDLIGMDYQLVVQDFWKRSPSPFEQLIDERHTRRQFVLVEEIFSDEFKNSLDGVKPKSSNDKRKADFKRKRNNRNRLSQSSIDSTDSKENYQCLAIKAPEVESDQVIVIEEESNSNIKEEILDQFLSDTLCNATEIQPTAYEIMMELNSSLVSNYEKSVFVEEIIDNEPNIESKTNILKEDTHLSKSSSNVNGIYQDLPIAEIILTTDEEDTRNQSQDDQASSVSPSSCLSNSSNPTSPQTIEKEGNQNQDSAIIEVQKSSSVLEGIVSVATLNEENVKDIPPNKSETVSGIQINSNSSVQNGSILEDKVSSNVLNGSVILSKESVEEKLPLNNCCKEIILDDETIKNSLVPEASIVLENLVSSNSLVNISATSDEEKEIIKHEDFAVVEVQKGYCALQDSVPSSFPIITPVKENIEEQLPTNSSEIQISENSLLVKESNIVEDIVPSTNLTKNTNSTPIEGNVDKELPSNEPESLSSALTNENSLPCVPLDPSSSLTSSECLLVNDSIVATVPQIESNMSVATQAISSEATSLNVNIVEDKSSSVKDITNIENKFVENNATASNTEEGKTKNDANISKPGPSSTEKKKSEPFWVN